MKEKLSALLDGELKPGEIDQTVKHVASESHMCEIWGRYHLIRDAMRGQLGDLAAQNLAEKISARLHNEPSILAPRHRRSVRSGVTKLLTGMAVAASVAAVAIIGVRSFVPEQNVQPLFAQSVESADYLRGGSRWQAVSSDVERDLNMYLVQHNEFTPATGMSGVMTYMRFVGYDNEK